MQVREMIFYLLLYVELSKILLILQPKIDRNIDKGKIMYYNTCPLRRHNSLSELLLAT